MFHYAVWVLEKALGNELVGLFKVAFIMKNCIYGFWYQFRKISYITWTDIY